MTAIDSILAQLEKLLAHDGKSLFRRAKLATEALAHDDWIESKFGGNDVKARKWLEKTYFPDRGTASLARLLAVYQRFPNLQDWESRDFDINIMWAVVYKDMPKVERRSNGRMSSREAAALKEECELLKQELELVKRERDVLKQELDLVKRERDSLKQNNMQLRQRLRALTGELSAVT